MSLRSAAEDEITLTLTLYPFDKAQGRRWNGRGDWFLASYPLPLQPEADPSSGGCGRGQGEGSDVQPSLIFQRSEHARMSPRNLFHGVAVAVLILFAPGCDPVINIGGTFFPGWMVAILIGSALTVAIRYIFVFTRVEPHLGPLALIYTSLGLLLSVVSWLILYRS
jgi:YtcA family